METTTSNEITKTRKNLHIPRRLFHMSAGSGVAIIYVLFLSREKAITILGIAASLVYLLEQIRINYPHIANKLAPFMKYLYRAEEQLKESAGVPMAMGFLLTIFTFPKLIAVTAVFTLAISDPLSALIGISYGKTHIVKEKSLEGSLAFLSSSFIITLLTFSIGSDFSTWRVWLMAVLTSISVSAFEMLPIKIDDNLTIPLAMGTFLSLYCWLLGINL